MVNSSCRRSPVSEILDQVAPAGKRGEKLRDGPSRIDCACSIGVWFDNYANVYIRRNIRCEEGLGPEKRVRVSFKREVCPKFEHGDGICAEALAPVNQVPKPAFPVSA